MPGTPHRSAAFIVRIWHEHGDTGAPAMRGYVEHVPTGATTHFRCYERLLAFINAHASPPTTGTPPEGAVRP
ncbi:hypothetical protein [Pseudoxanthomonas sp. JBR18]|uniref:hypothetical protein n=1 Tax=Pseudoxanthomonas sp. JBR18 TaxID=2969308 RepID=UPI002306856D|nr:hypothetical protein [Pseudoxanthomonas sp. JBR18]WCE03609.1 hypothetical protein PJ250_16155 [Pseudoxanthomonas sp. JBR18]